jgi:hypothetical protein
LKQPWSNARRTSGALLGLLVLGGCASLSEIMNRRGTPDTRVQLSSQTETLFLRRSQIEGYTCTEPLTLVCERSGTLYSCSCEK